jgi:HK97 gp10 family phage protein
LVWRKLMAKNTISFEVEGLSELVEAFTDELPKATATNVQKRALKAAADPIERDAKTNAPVRTGKLREKIDIGSKLSPRQKAKLEKESKVEIYVGPPSMERAIVAEFGSIYQTARPFMRPAWDANKRTAFNNIKEILEEEIEKARQRIARKTARLLAKANK